MMNSKLRAHNQTNGVFNLRMIWVIYWMISVSVFVLEIKAIQRIEIDYATEKVLVPIDFDTNFFCGEIKRLKTFLIP